MERFNEDQPAVGLGRFDARFQPPIARPIRFLDLLLFEMKCLYLRSGQSIQPDAQARAFLELLSARDQPLAGAAGQHWYAPVHLQDFQHLPCMREKFRRHKYQPKRYRTRLQLRPQALHPSRDSGLVEAPAPMTRARELIVHSAT